MVFSDHRHQLRHLTLLLEYLHNFNGAFVSYLVGNLHVSLLVRHYPSKLPNQLDYPLENIHSILV